MDQCAGHVACIRRVLEILVSFRADETVFDTVVDMANLGKYANLHRLLRRHRTPIRSQLRQRWLSCNAEWGDPPDFAGMNAYDILGVSPTSSIAQIKASFRKLAKETHPDVAQSEDHSSSASKNFVQILAAYEILSDATRRAHYDHYISSQRISVDGNTNWDTIIFKYNSSRHPNNQMEVVEWLKWYRHTINDVLSERRVTSGSGYFDILERDFYSAVHAAFYGPEIEFLDLLPDRFEADEMSVHATLEVLQLVSGRDLFGMVCLAKKYSELSNAQRKKLAYSALSSIELADSTSGKLQSDAYEDRDFQDQSIHTDYQPSDAYRDLELHLSGRVVAVATRAPPETEDDNSDDQIHISLISSEDQSHSRDTHTDTSGGHKVPLGIIKGLGTTSEEGTCYVYNNGGAKTHMIMKHRTLLVKHLHWFRIGEEISVCECRCSRARLPPSKYWLFEPCSAMHDVGGWRLHPAIYLLGLAYRTLDIEEARRRKRRFKDVVESEISRVFTWFRKVA